jgi:Tol biopolymer transport system component
MPLESGSHLGPYEIIALIGVGATGEVYKATDTQQNSTVALRLLPANWAEEPGARERLEHAMQALALLNHPNICAFHDAGRENDRDFLVMDYLEGQTLAQRLQRGALPLDEALKIATAIADALDKAHRGSVLHRNLKPSNVMLTESGIKLLDFGLPTPKLPARSVSRRPAAAPQPAAPNAEPAPTVSVDYMAPEQVEGGEADARTDVFALGTMLYEMITGQKAFEAKTQPMLIAAIVSLELEPVSKFQPASSPALDHLVAQCSAKSPDDRWQTVHAVLLQLQWITADEEGFAAAFAAEQRKRERWNRILFAVAAVLVAAITGPAFLYLRGSTADTEELRFRIPVVGLSPDNMALSPDGKTMALVIQPDNGTSSLYVRFVNSLAYRQLSGTNDAIQPFWSPDNRFIAFVSGGKLKAVEVTGGAPKEICDAMDFLGGTWSRQGTIVFGSTKGLFRVSAEGGKAEALTIVDKQETGHLWPQFLPDGQHYVYLGWSSEPGNRAVYVGALGSKDKSKVMSAESNAIYSAPGYLFFHREATIFAQPFDAAALKPTGQPIHIADQLAFSANGRGDFDVARAADNPVLIYFQGVTATAGRGQTVLRQFAWRSRSGQQTELAGEQGQYGDMDLSPDGRFIAVTRQESGAANADIWVIDWNRGVSTQLTRDSGDNVNPVWAPDGKRIAFTSYRKGNADVYVKNADGVGDDTLLLGSASNEAVEDWSKDGKYLIYLQGDDAFQDIYALPLSIDGKPNGNPIPIVKGHYRKDEPQLSYDGKWLAYTSDKTGGTFQVYVTSFPAASQEIQVSTDGGGQPRWQGDGKELYYRAPDSTVMAVEIKAGTKIEAPNPPKSLFQTNQSNPTTALNPIRHQWAVARDGKRFLVPTGNNQNLPRGGVAAQSSAPRVQGGNFTPSGQAGAQARGRVAAAISTGLTVIQHWTPGTQTGGKQ